MLKTKILTTTRIFFPGTSGRDSQIINANQAHQDKINEYTHAIGPDDLCKISTTPCLTDLMYLITTLITHT